MYDATKSELENLDLDIKDFNSFARQARNKGVKDKFSGMMLNSAYRTIMDKIRS